MNDGPEEFEEFGPPETFAELLSRLATKHRRVHEQLRFADRPFSTASKATRSDLRTQLRGVILAIEAVRNYERSKARKVEAR